MSEKYPAHRAPLNATVKRVGAALLRADVVLIPPLLQRVIVRLSALSRRQIVQNQRVHLGPNVDGSPNGSNFGTALCPSISKVYMFVPALFNCFFSSVANVGWPDVQDIFFFFFFFFLSHQHFITHVHIGVSGPSPLISVANVGWPDTRN